jgi:hypothetical protein
MTGGVAPRMALSRPMLLYNVAVVVVLAHARLGLGLTGIGLLPAAGLHAALAVWCAVSLRNRRTPERGIHPASTHE